MPETEVPISSTVVKTKSYFDLQRSDGFASETLSVHMLPPEEVNGTARLAQVGNV